jgi:hypothetical protein
MGARQGVQLGCFAVRTSWHYQRTLPKGQLDPRMPSEGSLVPKGTEQPHREQDLSSTTRKPENHPFSEMTSV